MPASLAKLHPRLLFLLASANAASLRRRVADVQQREDVAVPAALTPSVLPEAANVSPNWTHPAGNENAEPFDDAISAPGAWRDIGKGMYCEGDVPHVHLVPPETDYWKRGRSKSAVYRPTGAGSVLQLARLHAADALTMLDVGAHEPSFQSLFDWIPSKVATDLQFSERQRTVWEQARGISFVKGDFLRLRLPGAVRPRHLQPGGRASA